MGFYWARTKEKAPLLRGLLVVHKTLNNKTERLPYSRAAHSEAQAVIFWKHIYGNCRQDKLDKAPSKEKGPVAAGPRSYFTEIAMSSLKDTQSRGRGYRFL